MTVTAMLSATAARHLLAVRDLTDPRQGHHAIQVLVDEIAGAVDVPGTTVRRRHAPPVVPVSDNYDRLGYGPDAAARDARYTRYLTEELMLRSHTSSMVPLALEDLAAAGSGDVTLPCPGSGDATLRCPGSGDVTLLCPGIVYRRDVIDRQHVGEPHQLDVWRIREDRDGPLGEEALDRLVDTIIRAALPGRRWRAVPATHPYTRAGRQIDVAHGNGWVEVGECGLAHPDVLANAGLPPAVSGLASGWGLERLVMLRKGIDDIRLLRSSDPRVERQLHDLEPYQPVSSMPPAIRDLSVAVDLIPDPELLGDRLRSLLGDDAADIESVEILAVTPGAALPPRARQRLGMRPEQHNVLLRVVLRSLDRTLTAEEANRLRDRIYAAIHTGSVHQWASGHPPAATPGTTPAP